MLTNQLGGVLMASVEMAESCGSGGIVIDVITIGSSDDEDIDEEEEELIPRPEVKTPRQKSSNHKKPTEETENYWVVAKNKSSRNNRRPKKRRGYGQWVFFASYDKIDGVWEKIKTATEKGELGFASKASTMKEKDLKKESKFVIGVYTYDKNNKEDISRVRKRLGELGLKNGRQLYVPHD